VSVSVSDVFLPRIFVAAESCTCLSEYVTMLDSFQNVLMALCIITEVLLYLYNVNGLS